MSFAPSPTRAAATGAATASRPCWRWPRRPRCAALGATRRSTSGCATSRRRCCATSAAAVVNGAYERPSIYCLRNAIVKVAPDELDSALRAWFSAHGHDDASLAIDGKTMKGAVDEAGRQVHILGACGHETAIAWGQKKTVLTGDDGETKRTNEIGVAIPLLDQLGDLAGKTVTADALLTQTAIASYLRKHDAHYMFVAKDNQKTLLEDIRLWLTTTQNAPPTLPTRPASPSTASCRPRTDAGTARDLDHHRAQRLSPVPRRRAGLPHSPHPLPSAQGPGHRHLGRHLLGRDQPHPAHRRCPKAAAHQPRPLDHRKLPASHPR